MKEPGESLCLWITEDGELHMDTERVRESDTKLELDTIRAEQPSMRRRNIMPFISKDKKTVAYFHHNPTPRKERSSGIPWALVVFLILLFGPVR